MCCVAHLLWILTSHFTVVVEKWGCLPQVFPIPCRVSCQSSWSYTCPGVRVGPREVTEPSSVPTCKIHWDLGSGIQDPGWNRVPNTQHWWDWLLSSRNPHWLQTDQSEHTLAQTLLCIPGSLVWVPGCELALPCLGPGHLYEAAGSICPGRAISFPGQNLTCRVAAKLSHACLSPPPTLPSPST